MPLVLIRKFGSFAGKRLAREPRQLKSPLRQGRRAYAVERPSPFQSSRIDNQMGARVDYSQGKLYARPAAGQSIDQSPPLVGLQPLGTGARRDGLIYTPSSYRHGQPSPLCIIMHGAGGNAKGALFPPLEDIAEKVSFCMPCANSMAVLVQHMRYRYFALTSFGQLRACAKPVTLKYYFCRLV